MRTWFRLSMREILGLVLILCIVLAWQLEQSGPPKRLWVCVAAEEIRTGREIKDDMVRFESWPVKRVPDDVVFLPKRAIGQYARTRLYEGEPILRARLTDEVPGFRRGFNLSGNRVASIKVEMPKGMVRAGDRVDVIAGKEVIAANALVLKAEQRDEECLYWVHVILSKAQVERVVNVGESVSKFHVALAGRTISREEQRLLYLYGWLSSQ